MPHEVRRAHARPTLAPWSDAAHGSAAGAEASALGVRVWDEEGLDGARGGAEGAATLAPTEPPC
jgi:hypothetical protein